MPDHVHLIFTPLINGRKQEYYSLAEIMGAIKGASAQLINCALGRTGRVWQAESFDRVLRSSESLDAKIAYILDNPARKGLVGSFADYPWMWVRRESATHAKAPIITGKAPLEKREIIKHLRPKKIVAPNYDYEFDHARKNQFWHAYEPISLDLVEGASIKDKANNWVGRATSLADSKDKFKLHLLLGKPKDAKLQSAYVQAKNILHKMPGKPEFVEEDEAEDFADALRSEIKEHGE